MKNLIPAFIFLFLVITCQARTITVDDDDIADFNNIQAAIGDCNTGDIVEVKPGIYTGGGNRDIDFLGKAITVRSTNPNDPNIVATTIIDCNGTTGFYFVTGEDANSVVSGFTITNGCGGVYCSGSSPTIKNCTISGNEGGNGAGVFSDFSNPTITNCTIICNIAVGDGGGVWSRDSSLTLTNCTIAYNQSDPEGGYGGGIYCEESDVNIIDCHIIGNVAVYGGGIYCGGESAVNIIGCTIIYNDISSWDGRGGGIYLGYCNSKIINCFISRNTASDGQGGGIYAENWLSETEIKNCTISRNGTEYGGGGIYNSSIDLTISNCILWDNLPYEIGGEIAVVTYSCVKGGWEGEGNIDSDPLLTPDGHLQPNSPCIDWCPTGADDDIDGEVRPVDVSGVGYDLPGEPNIFDIGADEFVDTDADGMQDWWENKYFDSNTAADPNEDPDEDDSNNLTEYIFSTNPLGPYYINAALGNDRSDGIAPVWDGKHGPKKTIQAGLDVGVSGDTIVAAEGIYTGVPRQYLRFRGKAVTLRSSAPDNPQVVEQTIIDLKGELGFDFCEKVGLGFWFFEEDANSVLDGFVITGGCSNQSGGAIRCYYNSSPTIKNCKVRSNYSCGEGFDDPEGGGGICCEHSSSPTLINCIFSGNSALRGGGAIFCYDNSNPTILNCVFTGNSAEGGGVMWTLNSSPTLNNCVFTGNSGDFGGAVSNENSDTTMTNCTFSGNSGYWAGAIMNENGSSLMLNNCILWGDSGIVANEILSWSPSIVDVHYCDVQGGYTGIGGYIWPGNIDIDPCFVEPGYWDANDVWVDGDYHLKSFGWRWDSDANEWTWDDVTSRCIDAGNPGSSLGDEPLTLDVDPLNRWGENIRINMGAHGWTAEASMPPYDWALLSDLTNDGTVDFVDFAGQANDWLESESEQPGDLNRNGTVDIADLALLTEDWLGQTSWF